MYCPRCSNRDIPERPVTVCTDDGKPVDTVTVYHCDFCDEIVLTETAINYAAVSLNNEAK